MGLQDYRKRHTYGPEQLQPKESFMSTRAAVLAGYAAAFIFVFENLAAGQTYNLIYQKDGAYGDRLGIRWPGQGT